MGRVFGPRREPIMIMGVVIMIMHIHLYVGSRVCVRIRTRILRSSTLNTTINSVLRQYKLKNYHFYKQRNL